jgi:hypothetical protein
MAIHGTVTVRASNNLLKHQLRHAKRYREKQGHAHYGRVPLSLSEHWPASAGMDR